VWGGGRGGGGGRAISGISSDQSVPGVGRKNPQFWCCYGLLQVSFAKVEWVFLLYIRSLLLWALVGG